VRTAAAPLALGRAGVLVFFTLAGHAAAQAPEPPGPWVLDVRGVTSSLPSGAMFHPAVSEETVIPSRGYGLDVGAHVYLLSLGPARFGLGADYLHLRGTAGPVAVRARALTPQLSVNFGTTSGWSYLSGGVGSAWVRSTVGTTTGEASRDSGGVTTTNYGAGARWFLTPHLGVGFDVRWHRLTDPKSTLLSLAVGFAVH
jgi:hypothetical protein